MFQVIGVPYSEYRRIPHSGYRWLLICLSRYADKSGVAFPTVRQLAADSGLSPASVCRYLGALADLGVFTRERMRGGGRYLYRIAAEYRPQRFGVSRLKHGVSQRDTRQANPSKQRGFADLPVEQPWRQRVDGWKRSGFWLPIWGATPDEPGCLAPRSVIRAIVGA